MERPDQEAIDSFVTIAGVSESVAVRKLQEHGGDLNSALDAYFAESNENNVPVVNNVSAPRQDSLQLDDMDHFRSEFPLLSGSGILDRLFGTNNIRSLFHEPTFFPSRAIDESNFNRHIFDRLPMFPDREPFVSHPREAREIPIEVKDSNVSSSSPGLAPTIVDVTETEHDHGPGISGVVTMDDDEYASENDTPYQTTQADYASDNDIHTPARSAQMDYLGDDIEEQMILAALEASQLDAEAKQSVKSSESSMNLDEDAEDTEERLLVRQKTKSLSSGFEELPREVAERTSLNLSGSTDQDQNTIIPTVPDGELDTQQASLPQEPFTDENIVNILVRMPDGRRLSRRFLKSHKLKVVFNFIEICGGVRPGSYKLARSYPRRTFSDTDGALTLEEIGITSKHETLYLEPL